MVGIALVIACPAIANVYEMLAGERVTEAVQIFKLASLLSCKKQAS